jgi:hypothetical protein
MSRQHRCSTSTSHEVRIDSKQPARGVAGIYTDAEPNAVVRNQFGHDYKIFARDAATPREKKINTQRVMQSPSLDMQLFPLLFWGGGGWSAQAKTGVKRACYARQLFSRMKDTYWEKLGWLRQEW